MFEGATHIKTSSTAGHQNGNAFFHPVIQTKLTVNEPGDQYEQEADAMADKVMRMPEPSHQQTFFPPSIPFLQRKCEACEKKEESIQKKSDPPDIQKQDEPEPEDKFKLRTPFESMQWSGINSTMFDRGVLFPGSFSDSAQQEWGRQYQFYSGLGAGSLAGGLLGRFGVTAPGGDWNAWLANTTTPLAVGSALSRDYPTFNEQEERRGGLPAPTTLSIPVASFKLEDGSPDTPSEREADAVADKVVNETKSSTVENPSIQRKEEEEVQRKGSSETKSSQTENYIGSLSSKGTPLSEKEKSFYEQRIGADFSSVRIHTDANADQSAKSLHALAYTHGNNIVFRSGQYQPDTDEGKKLMAHELTHTIQQTGMVQRKPDCAYEKAQNQITGIGRGTKQLKAEPYVKAEPLPGDSVSDGDNVTVKNTGGAATYNNVKNCTWAWIEVPGKKSPDKQYSVLHGFIEVKYLKSTEVKKEEPKKEEPAEETALPEIVGSLEGPEIIFAGGAFLYTANALGPLMNPDFNSIMWSFKYDEGEIQKLDTKNAVTISDEGATLNVSIPASIKAKKFTIYAYSTSPEKGVRKESSLQSVSVVESEKERGKNADGTVADDMKFHDFTQQDIKDLGTLFKVDELANFSDEQLFGHLKEMATTLFSVGDLETNALAMIEHFKENTGTDYSNPILTKAVREHETTKRFIEQILIVLSRKVLAEKEGLLQTNVTKGELESFRPVFNSTSDTFAGGLTFAINDTWAHQADIVYYDYKSTKDFKGTLKVTIYDDFGLDKPDVEKKFGYLQGFRSWFILQHERGYKPFVTVVELEVPFDQKIAEIEPRKRAEEAAAKERAKMEKEFPRPPGGARY